MQSGGGVSEMCVCVCIEKEEEVVVVGGILWDACPLISLCVCARARGVCRVCEEEIEETASCAHAATHTQKTRKYY